MSRPKSLKKKRLYGFSTFTLDTIEGLFADGKPVKLAPKVFQTLTLLVENSGRILTKDEIFENVWSETFVEDSSLSFNISQLRKTLAKYDNSTSFIETIPKRGFRFTATVIDLTVLPEEPEIIYENSDEEIIYEIYQKQELIVEDIVQTESTAIGLKTKRGYLRASVITIATLIGFIMLSSIIYWQWQKMDEIRSFEELRSNKLVSWKSTESSVYNKYRVSNDGNLIAFSATVHENESIYIKQIKGGEDIIITKDSWDSFDPVWSPDDQQIAFVSLRDGKLGIYRCPSFSGNLELLKVFGTDTVSMIKWSKDGSVIFYEIKGNLHKLEIATKETSQITNFVPIDGNRSFSISTDETQFAFVENRDKQTDIFVMKFSDDVPIQITSDFDKEFYLVWHPHGDRILYNSLQDNYSQIKVAYLNGSEPLAITRGDRDTRIIDISNDGTRIFTVSGQDMADIWSAKIADRSESEIANSIESEFWAEGSIDGNYIAYQQNGKPYAISSLNDSSIVIKNSGSNTKRFISNGVNVSWLPQNKKISFLRWESESQHYDLWTFDVNSGEEKRITDAGVGLSGFANFPYYRNQPKDHDWSSLDEKLVYFDAQKQNIWLKDLEQTDSVKVIGNARSGEAFLSPRWSRNGKRIAFLSIRRPQNSGDKTIWNLWIWEAGATKLIFSTNDALRLLGWSSSDDSIVCFSVEGNMVSNSIDGDLIKISTAGKQELINTVGQVLALSMTMSADGRSIAFTKRLDKKDDIYVLEIENANILKVTQNMFSTIRFGNLSWSPDGKQIYFDKQERLNEISVLENYR